jgi:excisionase family DNA binding protein
MRVRDTQTVHIIRSTPRPTVTIAELAAAVGVSDETIRRLVARKEIMALRIGQRTMIPKDAAIRWIQQSTTGGEW